MKLLYICFPCIPWHYRYVFGDTIPRLKNCKHRVLDNITRPQSRCNAPFECLPNIFDRIQASRACCLFRCIVSTLSMFSIRWDVCGLAYHALQKKIIAKCRKVNYDMRSQYLIYITSDYKSAISKDMEAIRPPELIPTQLICMHKCRMSHLDWIRTSPVKRI